MSLAFAWLLAAAPLGHAQQLTVHDGWLIEPADGSFYENGVGSPTVAYDRANDTWVMFFETRFEAPDSLCSIGQWGIGRATSPDGLTWTVDDTMTIAPTADTFYGCVLAHPTILYDGERWRMWFKAQQPSNACADGAKPWGCTQVTGVGYAESTNGLDFVVDPEPMLNLTSFGFPTVVEVDGILRMLLAFSSQANTIYELWETVSLDDGASWSAPEVVVQPGFATWVEDEIYNPALVCTNEPPFRFVLWAGGRDTERPVGGAPRILTAALGLALSENGVDFAWDANSPYVLWDLDPEPPAQPDRDWRHWDVVRIEDDYLLFFSEFDERERNRVGLAYTYDAPQAAFRERRISDRICSTPEEQDTALEPVDSDTDTDADSDTDDTEPVETDESDETDTDVDAEPAGCGCAAPGAPPVAGLVLGVVALAARRRRR